MSKIIIFNKSNLDVYIEIFQGSGYYLTKKYNFYISLSIYSYAKKNN